MPHLLHEYHVMPWWLWSPIASWGLSMQRWLFYLLGTFLSRRFVIQLESSGEEDTYNGEWEQGNNSEWLKRYLWTVDCVSYEGQQWRNRMHINTIQSHFLEETQNRLNLGERGVGESLWNSKDNNNDAVLKDEAITGQTTLEWLTVMGYQKPWRIVSSTWTGARNFHFHN